MFVGHVGAGLLLARAEPRVNPGWFVTAALLPDLLLWVLLMAGVEHGQVPPGALHGHELQYHFPWSHGVAGGLLQAVGVALLAALLLPAAWRRRAALALALAVLSHTALDVLVHPPQLALLADLPAVPPGLAWLPRFLGLDLWAQDMPLALGLEAGLALLGLLVCLPAAGLSRRAAAGLVLLVLLLALFTAAGLLLAPPPSVDVLAPVSLATQALVCALVLWLGRARTGSGFALFRG